MAALTFSVISKQLLLEVTQLQQRLAKTDEDISKLPIKQQLSAIDKVAEDKKQFQELHRKVETFFSKTDLFDITDSVKISQQLAGASTHLKNISATQEKLLIYREVYSRAQEALKSTQPDRNEKLQSVVSYITQTTTKNTFNRDIAFAFIDLQKELIRATLEGKKEEHKTPITPQNFSTSQNSDLGLLRKEYDVRMQQKGSSEDIQGRLLYLFKKLRIASNANPSLKEDTQFLHMYNTVFNTFSNLHILLTRTDEALSKQMMADFKAILSATSPGSQQVTPIPVKPEENRMVTLQTSIKELQDALILLKGETPDVVGASVLLKALSGLEGAVNSEDAHATSAFLKVLEEVNLPNERNIAHALFGNLYRLHTESRKSNPALINPDDSRFHGDFGRNAFVIFTNGPEKKTKLQSIVEIQNSLKSAWGI